MLMYAEQSYPALGLVDEAALPASAIDFRLDAVMRMLTYADVC